MLGYLAADKLRRADIRLVEPYIAADGQSTVAPDYAADVELPILPRGEVGCGILDIAAHVARRVRNGDDAARDTAAVYAEGQGSVLFLHHVAHQRRRAQQTPQRGGRGGGATMDAASALHGVLRGDDRHFYIAVSGGGSDYSVVVHKIIPHFWLRR